MKIKIKKYIICNYIIYIFNIIIENPPTVNTNFKEFLGFNNVANTKGAVKDSKDCHSERSEES